MGTGACIRVGLRMSGREILENRNEDTLRNVESEGQSDGKIKRAPTWVESSGKTECHVKLLQSFAKFCSVS